jgi:hypothetical protein
VRGGQALHQAVVVQQVDDAESASAARRAARRWRGWSRTRASRPGSPPLRTGTPRARAPPPRTGAPPAPPAAGAPGWCARRAGARLRRARAANASRSSASSPSASPRAPAGRWRTRASSGSNVLGFVHGVQGTIRTAFLSGGAARPPSPAKIAPLTCFRCPVPFPRTLN